MNIAYFGYLMEKALKVQNIATTPVKVHKKWAILQGNCYYTFVS